MFGGGKLGEDATRAALALFEKAMEMQPSRAEAQAALYNAGCCHVKLRQWQPAVDAVKSAVNDWGVKLKVAQEVGAPSPPARPPLCICASACCYAASG